MTPGEYEHLRAEFVRLQAMTPADRAAALADLRARKPSLAREVESLLSHDAATAETATWRTPAASGPAPERLGRYRIVSSLPSGGMGEIYLAVRDDDQFHKRVAIKVIKKGMDSAEILARFELERQVLSALNHPNIARLLDAGQTADGRPYFAMEYVDGMPLLAYADAQQATTVERIGIFLKVCSAVAHAHANLVLHRDLKPGNILVSSAGEPKLLDFGIAKILNPDLLGAPVVTRPRHGPMTPEYASPEQIRGEPLTTASDVYTLGVLLYELLTGARPYVVDPGDPESAIRAICEEDPPAPSTVVTRAAPATRHQGPGPIGSQTRTPEQIARTHDTRPSDLARRLSGDLDNIILKAMRKSSQRRYPSVDALARDLADHLEGRPVSARPETWTYVLNKFVRRNRVPVAAALAAVVALGLGTVATSIMAVKAARSAELAQTRYKQTRSLAKSLIDNALIKIERTKNATAARIVLADTLTKSLEEMSTTAGNDPQLLRILADGYMQAADVQGGQMGGHLGDSRSALTSIDRAIELLSAVTRADPRDNDASLALLEARLRRAQMFVASANADEIAAMIDPIEPALAAFVERKQPGSAQALARCVALRGDLVRLRGEPLRGARPFYERARDLYASAASEGHDPDWRLRQTLSLDAKIADCLRDAGQTDDAIAVMQRVVAERRRLTSAHADDAVYQRDLVTGIERLADIQMAADMSLDAVASLAAARDIAFRASDAETDNARAAEDALRVARSLCEAALAARQAPRAVTEAASAERFVARFPADDAKRRSLVAQFNLFYGRALAATGERQEGLARLNQAKDALDQLAADSHLAGSVRAICQQQAADASAAIAQLQQ